MVYHGSQNPNIEILEPKVSSHGKAYVYGSVNKAVALLFLARWNDYIFRVGYDEDQLYLVENFQGAFQEIFKDVKGYLYEVEPSTFCQKKELWRGEVVSDKPVKIISKEVIEDISSVLESLDELKIYYYPERPSFYPMDDQDLIDRAVMNIRKFGEVQKERFLSYHHHLKERLEKDLLS